MAIPTIEGLQPKVVGRTLDEMRVEAPGIDDTTAAAALEEMRAGYPGFADGSSNQLDDDEGVFDARRAIRHSRTLTRYIFGIDPHPALFTSYWDSSTIQVKHALDRFVSDRDRLLEVGVGHVGINCLYLRKKRPQMAVRGIDVNAEVVANVPKVAAHNGIDFTPVHSNMWERVDGRFTVILFNAPYIPSSQMDVPKLSGVPTWVADGGDDGLEVIRRFVAGLPEHCEPGARVLLGINAYFVDRERTIELFTERGFAFDDAVRRPPFHNQVLIFSPPA